MTPRQPQPNTTDPMKIDLFFRMAFALLVLPFIIAAPSCAPGALNVDSEGCIVTATTTEAGQQVLAGTCPDGTHKIQWKNPEGIDFRAVWPQGKSPAVIEYGNAEAGQWFRWGAKAAVDPGPMPITDGQPPRGAF